MNAYLDNLKTPTPQFEPLDDSQVENNAGGYVYQTDIWTGLRRFLILGSAGGTYYVNEQRHTKDNAQLIAKCLDDDYLRTVNEIVAVSDGGLAPKNDPAIFALALALSLSRNKSGPRRWLPSALAGAAFSAIPKVCRTGTHLMQLMSYLKELRGFGSGLRKALSRWYTEKTPDQLAWQVVKYRNRHGWTHRDILRVAHPVVSADDVERRAIFDFVCGRETSIENLPTVLQGHVILQGESLPGSLHQIAREHGVPWEGIPVKYHGNSKLWMSLMYDMPIMALLRNLGRLSSLGLLNEFTSDQSEVIRKLTNDEAITKSRIHPFHYLLAAKTYAQGHGIKGNLTWVPNMEIVEALTVGFEKAFKNVEPSGKNFYVGVDVSGSMGWSTDSGLTAREAAAAMSMIVKRSENNVLVRGFSDKLVDIPITKTMGLQSVIQHMSEIPMGSTDCALPMIDAEMRDLDVDVFVVMTDNETWVGRVHPSDALRNYNRKRQSQGKPPAKLVVCAFTATNFSIADPNNPNMLDIAGLDASIPALVSEFAKGEF